MFKNKKTIKELGDKVEKFEDKVNVLEKIKYNLEDNIKRMEERHEYIKEQKDLRQKETIERMEKGFKLKEKQMEVEANIKISEAVHNFKDEKLAEIDIVNQELADANEAATGAYARADEKEIQIESLESRIVEYRDIIRDITKLLPKVDLSKFNVNVEVPEITINNKK